MNVGELIEKLTKFDKEILIQAEWADEIVPLSGDRLYLNRENRLVLNLAPVLDKLESLNLTYRISKERYIKAIEEYLQKNYKHFVSLDYHNAQVDFLSDGNVRLYTRE